MVFRHESFCLWESVISGFLNGATNDYISLDQNGLGVMSLSQKFLTKQVEAQHGQRAIVHSMQTCQYFKLNEKNHLLFKCSSPSERLIMVENQYNSDNGET